MTRFDSIIDETSQKFDLGDKAGKLLSAYLDLITNKETGGFNGFIERFDQAGLGDEAASWITNGVNTEISDEDLKSAVGADALSIIAEQTGTDKEKVASALAFMTPELIDELTPDGRIPDESDLSSVAAELPAENAATEDAEIAVDENILAAEEADAPVFIAEEDDALTETAGTVGDAAETVGEKISDVFESAGIRSDETYRSEDSVLKWVLPLIILSLMIVVGFYSCSDRQGKPALHKDSPGKQDVQNQKTEEAH